MLANLLRPLERLVTQKVAALLGSVFEGFDGDSFCLNLFEGEAVLEDLVFRKDAVAALGLPVELLFGVCRQVRLRVPWANLKGEAVEVMLDGVLLLLQATDGGTAQPKSSHEGLASAAGREFEDLRRKTQEAYGGRQTGANWDALFGLWVESLACSALEHLHVTLANVHVRYEDTHSHPQRPFAVGLTLEQLELTAATPDWAACPVPDVLGGPVIYKMLLLDRLSVYWNPASTLHVHSDDPAATQATMARLIPDCRGTPDHSFILQPCFLRGRVAAWRPRLYRRGLAQRRSDEPAQAQYTVELRVEDVSVGLSQPQYNDINLLLAAWGRYRLRTPYLATRPAVPVQADPGAWWRHAIGCVLAGVAARQDSYSWENIKRRRDLRREYLLRYRAVVVTRNPDRRMMQWLTELEAGMSGDDIVLFRSIGQARYGHLANTHDAPPVSMYAWLASSATRLLSSAQAAADGWWLDSEVRGFFERLQTDLGDELAGMQDRAQRSVQVEVEVPRITATLATELDCRPRSKAGASVLRSASSQRIAMDTATLAILTVDDVGLHISHGMAADQGATTVATTVRTVSLLASPAPGADFVILFGPRSPQDPVPLLDVKVLLQDNTHTDERNCVVRGTVGECVLHANYPTFARLGAFFAAPRPNRPREVAAEPGAGAGQASITALDDLHAWMQQARRRLRLFLRLGTVGLDVVVLPWVLVVSTAHSHLALDLGRLRLAWLPVLGGSYPNDPGFMVGASMAGQLVHDQVAAKATAPLQPGSLRLVQQGMRMVVVTRPQSWADQLRPPGPGQAQGSECVILSDLSCWLEAYINTHTPSPTCPGLALAGAVSELQGMVSSRKAAELAQLLGEAMQAPDQESTVQMTPWADDVVLDRPGPVAGVEGTGVGSNAVRARDQLLLGVLHLEGARMQLSQYNYETGQLDEFLLFVVDPIACSLAQERLALSARVGLLGVHLDAYEGPRVSGRSRGAPVRRNKAHTVLRLRGLELGQDAAGLDVVLLRAQSPQYAGVDISVGLDVGRTVLSVDPPVLQQLTRRWRKIVADLRPKNEDPPRPQHIVETDLGRSVLPVSTPATARGNQFARRMSFVRPGSRDRASGQGGPTPPSELDHNPSSLTLPVLQPNSLAAQASSISMGSPVLPPANQQRLMSRLQKGRAVVRTMEGSADGALNPPVRTNNAIRIIRGSITVYKVTVHSISIAALSKGAAIAELGLGNVQLHCRLRGRTAETSFAVGTITVTDTARTSARDMVWNELEEVVRGDMRLMEEVGGAIRADVRVEVHQFRIMLRASFVRRLLSWQQSLAVVLDSVAQSQTTQQPPDQTQQPPTEVAGRAYAAHSSLRITGELPLLLLACGSTPPAYLVVDLGRLDIDMRRAAGTDSCSISGKPLAHVDKIKVSIRGAGACLAGLLTSEEAQLRRIAIVPGCRHVLIERRDVLRPCDLTIRSTTETYALGPEEGPDRQLGEAAQRVRVGIKTLHMELADRDVSVVQYLLAELGAMQPDSQQVAPLAPPDSPPGAQRVVKSLGGRRMSVAAFEGKRSRQNSTSTVLSTMSTRSASSLTSVSGDDEFGQFTGPARSRGSSLQLDMQVDVVVAVLYYQREGEYLRDRGANFCTLSLEKVALHMLASADDTTYTSLAVPSLLLQDSRAARSGQAFRDVLTHVREPLAPDTEPTDLEAPSHDLFGLRHARASPACTAEGPAEPKYRPVFVLQAMRRASMYNAKCQVARPRAYLHVDFVNAFLAYLVPVDSRLRASGATPSSSAPSAAKAPAEAKPFSFNALAWSGYLSVDVCEPKLHWLERANDENSHVFEVSGDLTLNTSISAGAGLEVNCVCDVYVTSFDLLNRSETELRMLKPISMRGHAQCSDDELSVALQVSALTITVTYYDIKAIIVILKSVEVPEKFVAVDGEWTRNRYEEHDISRSRWFHAADNSDDDLPTAQQRPAPQPQGLVVGATANREENLDLDIGTVQFIFIDDSGSRYIPFLALKAGIDFSLRNWSSTMEGRAMVRLISTYYNARHCIWEPLIEPCYDPKKVGRRYPNADEDHRTADEGEPWSIRMEVSQITEVQTRLLYTDVVADRHMQITLSENMLDTMSRVSDSLSADYAATLMGEPNSKRDAKRQSPIRLVNNTGCTVTLLLTDAPVDGPDTAQVVKDGDDVDVWLEGDIAAELRPFDIILPNSKRGGRKVDISIDSWGSVSDIDMEMTGRYAHTVMRMADGRVSQLVIDVSYEDGAKTVQLRSTGLLVNELGMPLEVCYQTDTGSINTTIPPRTTLALPLHTKALSGIKVRPDNHHRWSTELLLPLPALAIPDGLHPDYLPQVGAEGPALDPLLTCPVDASGRGAREQALEPPFVMVVEPVRRHKDIGFVFKPPIVITNMLPLQFRASFTDPDTLHKHYTGAVEPGASREMYIDCHRKNPVLFMKLPRYGTGDCKVRDGQGQLIRSFVVLSSQATPLFLGIHWETNGAAARGTVYVDYWIVNKTGLWLTLQQSGLGTHEVRALPNDPPILFSFDKTKAFAGRSVQLKVSTEQGRGWTSGFSLDKIGTPEVIFARGTSTVRSAGPQVGSGREIAEEEVERDHEMGMTIDFGPVQLTKVVVFKPHLLLVNSTLSTLRMAGRFCLQRDNFEIPAGEGRPFYWCSQNRSVNLPGLPGDRYMCVRSMALDMDQQTLPGQGNGDAVDWLLCHDSEWSPPFRVDQPGNFLVKLGPPLGLNERDTQRLHRLRVLRCEITVDGATLTAVLREDHYQEAVRVENHSDVAVEFREAKDKRKSRRIRVLPGRAVPYAFDDPLHKTSLEWRVYKSKRKWVLADMNSIKRSFMTYKEDGRERIIHSVVFPDGPTRVLLITDQTAIINRVLDACASAVSSATETSAAPYFEGHVNMVGFGVSLVTSRPSELLYMQADGLTVDYTVSLASYELTCKLQHLQIDNQMDATPFPVLLTVTAQPGVLWNDPRNPFVHMKVVKTFSDGRGGGNLDVYRLVWVKARPISIALEESILLALLAVGSGGENASSRLVANPSKKMARSLKSCGQPIVKSTAIQTLQSIFFEHLTVSRIEADLSFSLAPGSDKHSSSPVIILLRSIGGSVSNISRAPIELNHMALVATMTTSSLFWSSLVRHYRRQALREIYKVFGSVEILGNPLATVHEVAFGFKTLGTQAYMGARGGHLSQSLALGFTTLGAYSFSGIVGMFVRISKGVGSVVAAATLDPAYLVQRRKRTNGLPESATQSLYIGSYLFVEGVCVGLTGWLVKPVQGAMREGAPGFAKGLGRGLVGVVVRPVLAVLDGTTYGLNTLVAAVSSSRIKARLRPPRYFNPDGIIRPYDPHSSQGWDMLRHLRNGKYSKEIYIDHVDLRAYAPPRKTSVVLVTANRLLLLRVLGGKLFVHKSIALADIEGRAITQRGIELHLRATPRHGQQMVVVRTYTDQLRATLLQHLNEVNVADAAAWLRLGAHSASQSSGSSTLGSEGGDGGDHPVPEMGYDLPRPRVTLGSPLPLPRLPDGKAKGDKQGPPAHDDTGPAEARGRINSRTGLAESLDYFDDMQPDDGPDPSGYTQAAPSLRPWAPGPATLQSVAQPLSLTQLAPGMASGTPHARPGASSVLTGSPLHSSLVGESPGRAGDFDDPGSYDHGTANQVFFGYPPDDPAAPRRRNITTIPVTYPITQAESAATSRTPPAHDAYPATNPFAGLVGPASSHPPGLLLPGAPTAVVDAALQAGQQTAVRQRPRLSVSFGDLPSGDTARTRPKKGKMSSPPPERQ